MCFKDIDYIVKAHANYILSIIMDELTNLLFDHHNMWPCNDSFINYLHLYWMPPLLSYYKNTWVRRALLYAHGPYVRVYGKYVSKFIVKDNRMLIDNCTYRKTLLLVPGINRFSSSDYYLWENRVAYTQKVC